MSCSLPVYHVMALRGLTSCSTPQDFVSHYHTIFAIDHGMGSMRVDAGRFSADVDLHLVVRLCHVSVLAAATEAGPDNNDHAPSCLSCFVALVQSVMSLCPSPRGHAAPEGP